jgi:triosephosphate isomerase
LTIPPPQLVGEKVGFAISAGLNVMACVGEKLEEREAGKTNDVVGEQLDAIAGNLFHIPMILAWWKERERERERENYEGL